MKNKILELASELSNKHTQLADFQIALADMKAVEEQMKITLFKESKNVDGVKTVADKENYVKEQMFGAQCYIDRKALSDKVLKLEAEIKGRYYKFTAIKTILLTEKNEDTN